MKTKVALEWLCCMHSVALFLRYREAVYLKSRTTEPVLSAPETLDPSGRHSGVVRQHTRSRVLGARHRLPVQLSGYRWHLEGIAR